MIEGKTDCTQHTGVHAGRKDCTLITVIMQEAKTVNSTYTYNYAGSKDCTQHIDVRIALSTFLHQPKTDRTKYIKKYIKKSVTK